MRRAANGIAALALAGCTFTYPTFPEEAAKSLSDAHAVLAEQVSIAELGSYARPNTYKAAEPHYAKAMAHVRSGQLHLLSTPAPRLSGEAKKKVEAQASLCLDAIQEHAAQHEANGLVPDSGLQSVLLVCGAAHTSVKGF